MKKLTIDNVTITKSSKDIETGATRNFSEKINVIYGRNEAGKSSLMLFLKNAFFKSTEAGVLNFTISGDDTKKIYKADIKDSGRVDKRLTLYDENGNICDNSFIREAVNKKYFEQGFTINLDDLMNIQNKDTSTLVDVIKDPTGQFLYDFTENLKSKVKKLYGDNNKPTKELNNIISEINTLTKEITKLSGNENIYNYAVKEIKESDEKLSELSEKEKLAELYEELKKYKAEYNNLCDQIACAEKMFNREFYNRKQNFMDILKNVGIFETNLTQIEKINEKISDLNEKISEMLNDLKIEYAFIPGSEFIEKFDIVNAQKSKVKELINKKHELQKTLAINDSQKSISSEALIKLNISQKRASNEILTPEDYEKLKNLYFDIKSGIEHYSSISLKLSNLNEKDFDTKPKFFIPALIVFGTVIASGLFVAGMGVYLHTNKAIWSGIQFAAIGVFGFAMILKTLKSNDFEKEKERLTSLKTSVLSELKTKISENNIEINGDEPTYLTVKFNEIMTELQKKLEKYERLKNYLNEKSDETDIINEKIRNIDGAISDTVSKLNETEAEIKNIVVQNGFPKDISGEEYLEMTIIVSELQNNRAEIKAAAAELKEKTTTNNRILSEMNEFSKATGLGTPGGNSFSENIAILKSYNEKNDKRKEIIDELKIKSEILIKKITEYENTFKEFEQKGISLAEIQDISTIKDEKETMLAVKKDAEFTKKNLEFFEGLNELKIGRELAIKEYKRKIGELIKYKTVLSLIEKSKLNFNKVQPCIDEAEKYLSLLTGGKYAKINLNAEEISNGDFTVIKKWNELSRGTKEQLYMALRLGYAANYSRNTVDGTEKAKPALPLIIDDAFVNFDEERLLNAFKCLEEFCKTNQVFFFTCRKSDVNSALNISGENVNIIQI